MLHLFETTESFLIMHPQSTVPSNKVRVFILETAGKLFGNEKSGPKEAPFLSLVQSKQALAKLTIGCACVVGGEQVGRVGF